MKPFRPDKNKDDLPVRRRRRLRAGIQSTIDHYERCLELTPNVDAGVFEAGMELFHSESALAEWLCAPAPALNNRTPLFVMRTAVGRAQVVDVLRSIAHGNVL